MTDPRRDWRSRFAIVASRFRLVHLAPLLAIIALGAWAFASPIGSAPDDDFHLTSVWCANSARADLCKQGPASGERVVPPAVLYAPCFAQDPKVSASCQTTILERGSAPTVVTGRGSFENNYPPLFYATMNLFAGGDILGSALLMRFVNLLLFVGLSVTLFWLLPAPRRSSMLWGWIISLVPLGLFIIASNNPSSWAVTGVGSSWLALLGYFETTGKRRVALGTLYAATTLMAAGARGDAAVYTILGAGIVALLTFRPERSYLLRWALPVGMSVVAAFFFFSSQQSGVIASGLGSTASSGTAGTALSGFTLLAYNLLNVPSLGAGVFGSWGLGWLDTAMPAVVSLGGLAVFIAVTFAGGAIQSRRKTISLVLLVLVLWLLPTYVLVRGMNYVGQNVQPRYLLPLIVILGGLAALNVGQQTLRLTSLQAYFVGAALAIGQSFALHFNLRRYLTGTGVQGVNLDANVQWWWPGFVLSPMSIWIVGSVAFAALIVILLRETARPVASIQ